MVAFWSASAFSFLLLGFCLAVRFFVLATFLSPLNFFGRAVFRDVMVALFCFLEHLAGPFCPQIVCAADQYVVIRPTPVISPNCSHVVRTVIAKTPRQLITNNYTANRTAEFLLHTAFVS